MDSTIASFYEIIDRDGDGAHDEEEFLMDWRAHGQPEEAGRKAFVKLDRNGDGKISKDEMVTDLIEAFYSEDPQAPGNWLALPDGPEA
jgi:Ca2+-binding EF-hand superfamily protein